MSLLSVSPAGQTKCPQTVPRMFFRRQEAFPPHKVFPVIQKDHSTACSPCQTFSGLMWKRWFWLTRWEETNPSVILTSHRSWFLSHVPSLPIFLALGSWGLLWVPPRWDTPGPSRAWGSTPHLPLRAAFGNLKLILTASVHPFWRRKCLRACLTQRAEPSTDTAPDEGNECFVYDRFLFLFPRFRSKLLQKRRQNLRCLARHYSSSNLGAADQRVRDSS